MLVELFSSFLNFSKVQDSKETENHRSRNSAKLVATFLQSHLLLDSENNRKVILMLLSCDVLD